MGMLLSQLMLPSTNMYNIDVLYYRSDGVTSVRSGKLYISANTCVQCNTYFNALYYPKYLRYCKFRSVRINVVSTGSVWLRLICGTFNEDQIIWETNALGDNIQTKSPWVDTTHLPKDGALYIELIAKNCEVVLHGGFWEAEESPQNHVRVAVVICTYQRESYVKRNLFRITEAVFKNQKSPIQNNLDVLIIDNGKTLNILEQKHVKLYSNRNYGGSGGFTRGLIEAYRSDLYTHVLFMDDDITLEPEILTKTIQMLKLVKLSKNPLCIGGQMLIEREPTIQFESGAFYKNGRALAINQGLDLKDWGNELKNEFIITPDYQGWWYCCFPLEQVKKFGLPLPFFIKLDDAEYGMRNHFEIITMNGIGVWHTAFSEKFSPQLEYYVKRNELVVSALYRTADGLFESLWKLIRASGKAILVTEPSTVFFLLKAYQDFLIGPDFFLQIDEEKLNQQLLAEKEKRQGYHNRVIALLSYPFQALPVIMTFIFHRKKIQEEFRERKEELTSLKFWIKHLGLE